MKTATRTVTLASGLTGVAAGPVDRDGPTVVCLHGMMGGAWQFERFQSYLATRGVSSLAINYRGHHDSRPVRRLGRVSVRRYIEDAQAAVAGLDRPVVVGQSMGGLIALALAANTDVSAVALVCALPPRPVRWTGARSPRFAWRHLPSVLTGRPLRPYRRELSKLILNRLPQPEHDACFDRQVPESSKAATEIAYGRVAVTPADIRCPVLSITAGDDALVSPSVGKALADRYHGRHLHYPNRGHYCLVAEPGWEDVARAITRWIDESTGQATHQPHAVPSDTSQTQDRNAPR